MAKLGTIFVEISLDDKVYKQKLSEIKPEMEATTKGLEQSWRGLGVKTNQYFEDSRRAAENAYKLIEKSGKFSADEIVRAEQAKNEKIKQLNEQQFGHQGNLLESVKKHWMAFSVAAVAAVTAVSKAWDLAEQGAGYIEQMQLLDGLAKQYGTSSTRITKSIREVGDGMISMKTAAEVATSAMAKGLKPDQIVNLGKAAVTLSDIMGKTVDQSFRDLSAAMEAGKEKSIKLAIGVIDLKEKYGLAADSMSEYEKQQALYNILMEKSAETQAGFGDSTKSIADHMETFRVRIENVKLEISMGLVRAGLGLMAVWDALGSASLAVSSAIWKIVEVKHKLQAMVSWGEAEKRHSEEASQAAKNAASDWQASLKLSEQATSGFKTMTASTEELVKSQAKSNAAIKTGTTGLYEREKALEAEKKAIEAALKKMVEETRQANVELEGIGKTQYEKDIARIESEAEKHLAATKNKVAVNEWKAVQIQLADQKQSEETKKQIDKNADDFAKSMAIYEEAQAKSLTEQLAADKKYADEKKALAETALAGFKALMTDEADFAATENERAINKIIANEGEKLNKLYQIYADGGISYKAMQEAEVQITQNATAAKLNLETENANKLSRLRADLITNIKGQEEQAYQARLKQIQTEAAIKLKDLGADKASAADRARLARWVADQQELAFIQSKKSGDDFFDGMAAGYLEMTRNAMTFGKAGYEIFNTFVTASKTAVSDVLFAAIKTGTVDAQAVWTTFSDTMLRKFTDTLAAMVVEAAAQEIKMFFMSAWKDGGSTVLGIINSVLKIYTDWTGESATGKADGGYIAGAARYPGDHPGNDTVLARLSPGEYVMPRSAVNASTLPALEHMRTTKSVPGYAEGGGVTDPRFNPYRAGFDEPNKGKWIWLDNVGGVKGQPKWGWTGELNPSRWVNARYEDGPIDPTTKRPRKGWSTDYNGSTGGWYGVYLEDNFTTSEDIATPYRLLDFFVGQGYIRPKVKGWFDTGFTHYLEGFYNLPFRGVDANQKHTSAGGWGNWLDFFVDPTGTVGVTLDDIGKSLPQGITDIIPRFATAIGSIAYGAAGAAIGAGIGSKLAGQSSEEGFKQAAVAFVANYLMSGGQTTGGIYGGNQVGTGDFDPLTGEEIMAPKYYAYEGLNTPGDAWGSAIMKTTFKWIIDQCLNTAFGDRGECELSYQGSDDKGLLKTLQGLMGVIAPQTTPFAFSARNGLSYVPRDNFPIRAHEGEAVLTKREAQQWRSGGGQPSIGVLKVFIGNQEIKDISRVEADGVIVARNQRNVNAKQRVYQ